MRIPIVVRHNKTR